MTSSSCPCARVFNVPDSAAGMRLDAFVAAELSEHGVSRSKVKDCIKQGHVSVDGITCSKPKQKLLGGESVSARIESAGSGVAPEPGELVVLYEDDHLAVIDKPAGLTVHPAPGLPGGTLVNRIAHRWPKVLEMEGERPGIVHRIDKDTSGLILVALEEATRLPLAEAFAERTVDKCYLALVFGRPQSPAGAYGDIDAPIGRHPRIKTKMAVVEKGGREALSSFETLWTSPDGFASLVKVKIHTGRTHQIRVHMAHIGHPLLGDMTYGTRQNTEWMRDGSGSLELAPRQMLHAWKLEFSHPAASSRKSFCVAPPEDFRNLANTLARQTLRVGIVGMPGCGKSALCARLREQGYPVFSADACVESLYRHQADGWVMLRRRFGEEVAPDGADVNKARLFEIMRESDVMRREVLDTVHPLVRHRMQEFWRDNAGAELAFAEVPLLLEGGWDEVRLVDTVMGVTCPAAVRRDRLAVNRGWDETLTVSLEGWQWPEKDKLARCSVIVDNGGTLDVLDNETIRVVGELQGMASQRFGESAAFLESLWAAGGSN